MFLYTKPNALPQNICRGFIDAFETSEDRQQKGKINSDSLKEDSSIKNSTDISFTPKDLNNSKWGNLLQNLVNTVELGIVDYRIRFQVGLDNTDPFRMSPVFNMQRYRPSEGFYNYHSENGGGEYANRILAWMVYLNTLTDRGETEYYYQHHFERPEEGKLVIWPADWTYTHRGIPSPTQTKYILTGWFVHYKNEN